MATEEKHLEIGKFLFFPESGTGKGQIVFYFSKRLTGKGQIELHTVDFVHSVGTKLRK